jgi:hypothetical protein
MDIYFKFLFIITKRIIHKIQIKKMKIISTTLSIVFLGILSAASQGINLPTDYIRNEVQGNNLRLDKVQGSPYLNSEFDYGKVHVGEEMYGGQMRYNAFSDEIQLKENDGKIISLLKRNYISAEFNSKTFEIHSFEKNGKIKQGYFSVLVSRSSKDLGAIVLQRFKKNLIPAKEASSSYTKATPARFADENNIYIKVDAEPAKQIKLNKKGILSLLPKNKSKVEAFIKKNRLKLKKETELMTLVNYYNSLL